ncbi:MAG: ABC transporter ATP-binding protein [Desulfobacterales bacterium]|nr:ABC transporter ATP-binding protein [Desulfobacterales bacterium]
MALVLQSVDKVVGREVHLKDIGLELAPGSRHVILGRTLAGKTSLLRILAGLDRPTAGRIFVDGRDVTGVGVRKRSVAMVYQQFINYPSLTVYANIASPLKLAGMAKAEIDRRVRETAAMLHIDPLLDRLPAELSGGQQQRTAIARALVKESQLLLLDEPLVNLDYKLREELRVELQQIFQQRSAVVVYTTTEPAEALMLGGNIVVMDQGRILQAGPTPEVYRHPATVRVAEIFSDPPINFIQGRVHDRRALLGHAIQMPLNGHMDRLASGPYIFGVRCNHLFLNSTSPQDVAIRAAVELCEINGSETFIHISYENARLVVQGDGVHLLKIGQEITVYVHPCHLFVYDPEGKLVASPDRSCHAGA